MQADVEEVHGEKGGSEDQRDRDGDDHAGTQTEADESDQQYNDDGLGQRLYKRLNRAFDGIRLAGRFADVDADREIALNAGNALAQILAELDDVAASHHRDADG